MSKSGNSEELKQTSQSNRVTSPYTAITLDTCIYRKYKFRFDSGLLQTIPKLHVTYAITEIVLREINDHVADLHNKLIKELEETRDHFKQWKLCSEDELIRLDKVLDENAVRYVSQEFLKTPTSIGVSNYIQAERCDIIRVLEEINENKLKTQSLHKPMYSFIFSGKNWSERRDLNPRPLHPQCSALPGCATLRPNVEYKSISL